VPLLVGELVDRPEAAESRVVDPGVEAPPTRQRDLGQPLGTGGLADVRDLDRDPLAERSEVAARFVDRRGAAAARQDAPTLVGEGLDDGAADAAGAAGDDGDFVVTDGEGRRVGSSRSASGRMGADMGRKTPPPGAEFPPPCYCFDGYEGGPTSP
jgi:hypothetical protein